MTTFKYTILFIIFFAGISCKAQSPIINIEDNEGDEINNAYYKDTNHLLDPFVGTWVFDNGTQYLKIVFEKKTMVDTGNYYEDLLIGEFMYTENNELLVSTLYKLTTPLPNVYHHSIDGNYIRTNHTPFDDYTTDNFRISLSMSEPNGCFSKLDVRTATVNGQQAIQIFKRGGFITLEPGETSSPEPFIPGGFYFLIKQ